MWKYTHSQDSAGHTSRGDKDQKRDKDRNIFLQLQHLWKVGIDCIQDSTLKQPEGLDIDRTTNHRLPPDVKYFEVCGTDAHAAFTTGW